MTIQRLAAACMLVATLFGLTACSHTAIYSENGSTTVRGSGTQIYGTINQSYTRTRN